jgi:hypothetical protein
MDTLGGGDSLTEDFATTCDKDVSTQTSSDLQSIFQIAGYGTTGNQQIDLPGDNYGVPLWQWFSYGFIGFSPHNQGMTSSNLPEQALFSFDFPGNFDAPANDIIFCSGCYQVHATDSYI